MRLKAAEMIGGSVSRIWSSAMLNSCVYGQLDVERDGMGCSHICRPRQLGVGFGESSVFFRRASRFPLELQGPLLGLFVIQPLALPLLDGLANRRDGLSGVDGGLYDVVVDQDHLFPHVRLQLCVRLLQTEGALKLERRRGNGLAQLVTVGGAGDGVVEALIFGDDLQLMADKGGPGFPPHLCIVDDLERRGETRQPSELRTAVWKVTIHLCENTVRILEIIQQNSDLGIFSGTLVQEIAKLPLHRLHRGSGSAREGGDAELAVDVGNGEQRRKDGRAAGLGTNSKR